MIRHVDDFSDYELLDCGDNEKAERFGAYILKRPDPQAIWHSKNFSRYKFNAIYHRSKAGGGSWEFINLPKKWTIHYDLSKNVKLSFNLKPFTFKHTGIFPEQAINWKYIYKFCSDKLQISDEVKVLNLFAYTGAATMAAAKAGAKVTHVDASKGILTWAKENAELSHIENERIRWIVDDCKKFVEREIRRKNLYDGIIMDPPSYGRGSKGEVWKIESDIYDFINLTFKILKNSKSFLMLNSYTTGLQTGVMDYMVKDLAEKNDIIGETIPYELGILCKSTGLLLPEGSTIVFKSH